MTKTTHRPSFRSHCEPNSFYSVAEDGTLTFDGERMTYCPDWLVAATAAHERDGSHPDCIRCQDKARRQWEQEIEAQAADARDLRDTQSSLI